ncbi:hypothetical protein ACLOJK_039652 [Asimina triloba]
MVIGDGVLTPCISVLSAVGGIKAATNVMTDGGLKLCTYPPPVVPNDGQLRHLQFCQALALGCFPLVKVVHTSAKYEGQVYISEINYILMIACVAVTAGFQTTVAISNAYGLAVVFVTTLTSAFLDLMRGLLFGRLISESGRSSIENYECGYEEQKQLWEILQRAPGVYGARFSGAGFGGCCTAFVDTERAVEAAPLSGMSTVKFSQIWPACSVQRELNEEEVVKYVARMLPVLATSNFLDGVQCLLSGIARGCGWQKLHEDLDLDLEEISMSVAIWRSIQDLGQPCESSSTVGCRSSGHVSNLCGLSPAFVDDRDIPSADSIKAGLAVAVAKANPGLGSVFDADRVLVSEVVNVECCSSSSIHALSNGSGDSSHGFNDGADSSCSHLSPPTVVRPVMMAPNWTCLWRSSASLRHGSVAVLRAGEDIITVIWGLNGTTHRGVDSQYKKVKVEHEIIDKPYTQSNKQVSIDWMIKKDVPTATYFVRAYVVDDSGKEGAYGQNSVKNKATNLFSVQGISGRHASLDIAAACFSAFAVVSLFGFFYEEKRKAKKSQGSCE